MTKRQSLLVVYVVFRTNAGPTSTRFGGFVKRLQRLGDMPQATYKTVALEDMMFVLDNNGRAAIYGQDGVQIFHDASFVYFKSWEAMPEQASMVVSYLEARGVPYEDRAVRRAGVHKASQLWRLWAKDVQGIPTIVANQRPSKTVVVSALGDGPYLTKPIHGEKGRGVEKVQTYEQLPENLQGLLLQQFVENKGDFRVLTYGYEVRGALLRRGKEGSAVNNTSAGGTSEYYDPATIPDDVKKLAVRAARVVEYAVAGVDIMVDMHGRACVLEVNQGSQIVTGHFVEKKAQAFATFLRERLDERYARKQQNDKLAVIGRYVNVNFPEFDVREVFAKVDTGAYQSAVHATDIREIKENGENFLEFSLFDGHGKTAHHMTPKCRVAEYEKTFVKSSNGQRQPRYVIKTRISINGRMMKTSITLTDRKDMVAPVLLGRRFLRGRYIVNVELSRIGFERLL